MKTITLFFALIAGGLTSVTFGQSTKVWAQINDLSAIPAMNADGMLIFKQCCVQCRNKRFQYYLGNASFARV